MNNAARSALRVACPVCGAQPGALCDGTHVVNPRTKFYVYATHVHKERWIARPLAKIAHSFAHVHNLGSYPCGHCAHRAHYKCTGRHGRNHGVLGELCTCDCERAVEARKKARHD